MVPMHPITYTSRDGLTIEGYLTLPKGYTMENAKNLPVVVNPHGGPWARDSWGYNPEVQFLAKPWLCCSSNEFPSLNRLWTQNSPNWATNNGDKPCRTTSPTA